jgi:hypothetical protein
MRPRPSGKGLSHLAVKSFDVCAGRRPPRGGKMLEAENADFNRQSYPLHKYLVMIAKKAAAIG